MSELPDTQWRYHVRVIREYEAEDTIRMERLPVIKATECCVWLQDGTFWYNIKRVQEKWRNGKPVLRRYAWPTKEESLFHFLKKKERHLAILVWQYRNVRGLQKQAAAMYKELTGKEPE